MIEKHASIRSLIARLELRERGWVAVDHWEADRCAIGIAREGDRARLVYVSTFDRGDGRYFFACEMAPTESDRVYRESAEGECATYAELVDVLVRHLG